MTGASATEEEVNTLQFLSMLLLYLPEGLFLTTNAGKWAEAIRYLRERFEERFPTLFAWFGFVERPPAMPYCPQVSEFLTWIYASSWVEVTHSIGRSRMAVLKDARDAVFDVIEGRLTEQTRVAIKEIADHLVSNEETRQLLVIPG